MVTLADLCRPEVVQPLVKRIIASRAAKFKRFGEFLRECKRLDDEDSCDEPIVVCTPPVPHVPY